MNIEIKHVDITRYPTLGDYFRVDDTDVITVLDTKVDIYNKLVAIHELIEWVCTQYKGIKEEDITQFDLDHLECDEPGEYPNSPYKSDHILAEIVERMICNHLDIDWNDYNKQLNKVFEDGQSRFK
jgi:hypothetical protein